MPKILINEVDRTSPGEPSRYENYSVLIAGFVGYDNWEGEKAWEPAGEIPADSNGVYEFTNAADFVSEIGLNGPKYEPDDISDGRVIYHYGNRMAYELLNMGFTVIYVPITKVSELYDPTNNMWDLFRDKASYDFRFISHGLLESNASPQAMAWAKRLGKLEAAEVELQKYEEKGKKLFADTKEVDAEHCINKVIDDTRDENNGLPWLPESPYKDQINGTKDANDITINLVYDCRMNIVESISQEKTWLSTQIAGEDCLTTNEINTANMYISQLAAYVAATGEERGLPGRGDCVALIELDEKLYYDSRNVNMTRPEASMIEGIQAMSSKITSNDRGKYCAMTVPSVHYKGFDEGYGKFPGAFHYLTCFKNALDRGFAEWYAAAGYTRGVSSYAIDHTTVDLGEIAINALEPRYRVNQQLDPSFACNVIANFRGNHYLWGNRTCHMLQDGGNGKAGDLVASHFLNIRQLCSTLKKQLYVVCRRFTFDPNSDVLWINFVNAIRPTLDLMKADQGIRDYKIVKEYTSKKATLKAKIRIIPIEAVEDFDLEVSLEDSFGETVVTVGDL